MSEMKELALGYARDGIAVFPCRAKEEEVFDEHAGKMTLRKEKTPYPSTGFKAATTSERLINRLWDKYPDAAVGVATGEKAKFWVLDVDVPSEDHSEDGRIWLDEMEAEHGPLPVTKWAYTANGGIHFLFNHVPGVRNRAGLAPGIDTRGDGGYIVAPGSVLADGRFYEWADETDVIADAPQWLLDMVVSDYVPDSEPTAPARVSSSNRDYKPSPSSGGKNPAYAQAALDSECSLLASTGQGKRGEQLNSSAHNMGMLVGAGELSRGEVENALYQAAAANGSLAVDGDKEIRAKIRRGMQVGERKSGTRSIPEPTFQNADNTRLRDLSKMISRGLAKADLPEGQELEDEPEEEEESPIVASRFEWIDPTTIPRRQFAFGRHYIRKYVSVTGSPGGIGKTSNSIVESLSMVTGKPILNIEPEGKLRVWLYNAEDPREELDRRIMAAALFYDISESDIGGRLFRDSGRDQELIIAREDKRAGVVIQEPIVEAVVEQITRNKIDVMIIDPFVSTHSVNENDNGAIDKVAKLWSQIAGLTNCAIDIVHHLKKVSDREATVEDMRGAVALIGAARSVRVFNLMSEQEEAKAGLERDSRLSIFNITEGKSNLSARSGKKEWRQIVGQGLGNGKKRPIKDADKEDSAPVITPWKWPAAPSVTKTLDSKTIVAIKNMCRNRELLQSPASQRWAGFAVAEATGLPSTEKEERAELARLLKALIKEGFLKVEFANDISGDRKDKNFIRAVDDTNG
jgi:RecA-family ATPase